jgi:hypothetical protein
MSSEKSKMSGKPPKPNNLNSFLEDAEKPHYSDQTKENTSLPWQGENVRSDVIKSINLRLPEDYILKLQFISQKTYKSQQMLIKEALLPFIDEEIERLLK